MPMIATTIISSIRVKPCWMRFIVLSPNGKSANPNLCTPWHTGNELMPRFSYLSGDLQAAASYRVRLCALRHAPAKFSSEPRTREAEPASREQEQVRQPERALRPGPGRRLELLQW